MTKFSKEFYVSNASNYERNDYVEFDIQKLDVPDTLNEESLRLIKIEPDGKKREIAYQIDKVLGLENFRRMITFMSSDTPAGKEDYSQKSSKYILEEAKPSNFITSHIKENLWVGHYYKEAKAGEPLDGFNKTWHPKRALNGVKLFNSNMEIFFSAVRHPRFDNGINYTGAFTSIVQRFAKESAWIEDMLCPFNLGQFSSKKIWGQIHDLVFFPLPWEHKWFQKIDMLDKSYELVWSNSGCIRAIAVLKSDPFTVEFEGTPYFKPGKISIECNLYRIIYMYPETNYFFEEMLAVSKEGIPLSFRPYIFSYIDMPHENPLDVRKFAHIPDYFTLWKWNGLEQISYGFTADSHVRGLIQNGNEIRWRLSLSRKQKCLHNFSFYGLPHMTIDPFSEIGKLWYEKVFKPIQFNPINPDYFDF